MLTTDALIIDYGGGCFWCFYASSQGSCIKCHSSSVPLSPMQAIFWKFNRTVPAEMCTTNYAVQWVQVIGTIGYNAFRATREHTANSQVDVRKEQRKLLATQVDTDMYHDSNG